MNIGSLCTGYGGLDMALDGDTVWVSDIDKHAAKLLAHRFPTVPNLGDLTAVDWEAVEPVDIITAGYPCQPFSHAGKREGQNDERHIWPHIANAIRVLRPGYVFLENVAGHLSLGLGDVLADLAKAGYDTEWVCVRASDVGAPHRRERLFILATDTDCARLERRGGFYGQGGEIEADAHYPTHFWQREPPNPNDAGDLNPQFVEWMMGLPAGWVTDVPGISRTGQLHLLGNGVVPQQAAHALAILTDQAVAA